MGLDETTADELRASGYKEWRRSGNGGLFHPHAKAHFQKKVVDSLGIKYFVNAYEYVLENSSSFQWEVQFSSSPEGYSINTTPLCRSVKEAEEFFESFWNLYTELGIIDYYERR